MKAPLENNIKNSIRGGNYTIVYRANGNVDLTFLVLCIAILVSFSHSHSVLNSCSLFGRVCVWFNNYM
jgi:hypothetical protein